MCDEAGVARWHHDTHNTPNAFDAEFAALLDAGIGHLPMASIAAMSDVSSRPHLSCETPATYMTGVGNRTARSQCWSTQSKIEQCLSTHAVTDQNWVHISVCVCVRGCVVGAGDVRPGHT